MSELMTQAVQDTTDCLAEGLRIEATEFRAAAAYVRRQIDINGDVMHTEFVNGRRVASKLVRA